MKQKLLSSFLTVILSCFFLSSLASYVYSEQAEPVQQQEMTGEEIDQAGTGTDIDSGRPALASWLHMLDKNAFLHTMWNGKNTLGHLLMQVRDNLHK